MKWYDAAATQGSDLAKKTILDNIDDLIGEMGATVLREDNILKWANKSAELGNIQTMERLATCYCASGDKTKTLKWWMRALELRRGNEHFTTAIDWLFDSSRRWCDMRISAGEQQNEFDAAVKMVALRCQKLAEEGNGYAQLRLSKCFEFGCGVKHNYRKTVYWCQAAAENKVPGAEKRLAVLKEHFAKLSVWDKMFG